MIISVSNLNEGDQLQVQHDYSAEEIGVQRDDLLFVKPITFDANVERIRSGIIIKGHLSSDTKEICCRCLEETASKFRQPIDLYCEIKDQDSVDVVDDLREAFILASPVRFLCKAECKGLCPKCGINLNEKACSCKHADTEPEETDHPFGKLSEWFYNSKKERRD